MKALAFLLIGLAALAACSSSSDGSGACTEVRVFNSSFANYHSWTSYSFDGPSIANSPHTSGPRREYLSQKPAHGATSFPVGTIIVKEIGAPPASQDSVFAMVKVGCGYNSDGADGWEWYELQVDASGTPSILWDGPAASARHVLLGLLLQPVPPGSQGQRLRAGPFRVHERLPAAALHVLRSRPCDPPTCSPARSAPSWA